MLTKAIHRISPSGAPATQAGAAILGVNLELVPFVASSLMSNRLKNPKFNGMVDSQAGVAIPWQISGNSGTMRAELVEGMFMSPSQSQLLHRYTEGEGGGIIQIDIPVKGGEHLEFTMWAKVRHQPVCMEIRLGPLASRVVNHYASEDLIIDTSYWKQYRVDMPITHDDEHAALSILFKEAGMVYIDQVSLHLAGSGGGVDADTQEAILRINPAGIRFPGGCMSTNHHWRLGIGRRELRPSLKDPVFHWRADYEFGTDEYLELCDTLNIGPHITVNIGSGTPEDASAWAAYCHAYYQDRHKEPPLAYFQLGNEHYGSWESSHMTPDMYVEALQSFVPGIRAAYPRCRIIALAEPLSDGAHTACTLPWQETVLTKAQGCFDVLALNRYKGQWFDDPEEQLANAIESVGKIRSDLESLARNCREAGITPRLAVTEWNYWLHASRYDGKDFFEPDDVMHGLFFSGMINAFIRMGDTVEVASYYHLLNVMGLLRETKGQVKETGLGALFRLYRPVLPGQVVPLSEESMHHADALAVMHGHTMSLFLTNSSSDEMVAVDLDEVFGQIVTVHTLAAEGHYASMREVLLTREGRVLKLPRLSVTRLDFEESVLG